MVPAPPDFGAVTPLMEVWPRGQSLVRVFNPKYHPGAFNPGSGAPIARGRFHFFADAAGAVVPALYAAESEDAAIVETIFHDVPVRGAIRSVHESRLAAASMVHLQPQRDLSLVQLHGFGLQRLGVRPGDLTDTEATEYPQTVLWARELHAALPAADGVVWMSRQFNSARAVVLFGDRVQPADLAVASGPLSLIAGPGRVLVEDAANRAGILVLA